MKGNRGVRNTENLIHHQSRTSVLAVTFERKCDFFFVHNPFHYCNFGRSIKIYKPFLQVFEFSKTWSY